jgi:pimeloyl-ACP methyl ester carboxylesterase
MSGGSGNPLLVLLHGIGTNGSVWRRFIEILNERWNGRWLAPDFRGHGRSLYQEPYGYAMHAADIAGLMSEFGNNAILVGHSFGGVIAALIGSGWFSPLPLNVLAFGVKIIWTDEEVRKIRELAKRPAHSFATRGEAIDRYLKISGLSGLIDPKSGEAAQGITGEEGNFRVAMDMRAYEAIGPSISEILRLCKAPLRLAAGEKDSMTSLKVMQPIDRNAAIIDGLGHNFHLEAPEHLWHLLKNIIQTRA